MNRNIYNALELAIEADGKSNGAYREYFANISYMEKFFKNKKFEDITKKELKKYVNYLNEKYHKSTYNNVYINENNVVRRDRVWYCMYRRCKF